MINDLYYDVVDAILAKPQDITNHTDVASLYVDMESIEERVFTVEYGTVTNTDANNKVVAKLQICAAGSDPALDASYADAASADLIGSFGVVDAAADDDVIQKVKYVGTGRYGRVLLDFTSAGANPDHCPVRITFQGAHAHKGPARSLTLVTGASNG